MNAGPRRAYWGAECKEAWGTRKQWRYVCRKEGELKEEVREVIQQPAKLEGGEDFTTREMITGLMMKGNKEEMMRPKMKSRVDEKAPEKPNASSDGSLRNIKGAFWQVGGAGVWRPVRKEAEITGGEKSVAEYQGHERGVRLWCTSNTSLNSSTRCEL